MTAGMIKPNAKKRMKGTSQQQEAGDKKEQFPRVMAMFRMPIEERWKVAKTFTKEEQEFSLKMQRHFLYEEKRMDYDSAYYVSGGCSSDEEEEDGKYEEETIGDSDDGSI